MRLRGALRATARRIAPGTVAALDDVRRLRADVDALTRRVRQQARRIDALEESLRSYGAQVERFDTMVTGMHADVTESRRLSLRIGQLTDLVFDRLGDAGPASGARTGPDGIR